MLSHITVKKFIPVFDRVEIQEVYKYPTGMNFEKIKKEFSRYERWSYNYWTAGKTSKPKTLWAINRIRRSRVGQLNFLKEILSC